MEELIKLNDLKLELKKVDEEYEEFYQNNPNPILAGKPISIEYKCPTCSAKKGIKCKTSSGIPTHIHAARKRLAIFQKDREKWNKEYRDYKAKINTFNMKTYELKGVIQDLEAEIKKKKDTIKFLKNVTISKVKPHELTIEWDGYTFRVMKFRNIKGIKPGNSIINQDIINALMDKGVDVTVMKKENETFACGNSYPFWR